MSLVTNAHGRQVRHVGLLSKPAGMTKASAETVPDYASTYSFIFSSDTKQ